MVTHLKHSGFCIATLLVLCGLLCPMQSPALEDPDPDPPGDPAPVDPGGDGGMSDTQRTAAMDSIQDFLDGRPFDEQEPHRLGEELVAFLLERPEFEAAGIEETSASVWARFTDGRLLVVALNEVMPAEYDDATPLEATPDATQKAIREHYALPGPGPAGKVYLLSALDRADGRVNRHLNTLSQWFTEHGYAVIIQFAEVDGLQAVKDAAVLYICGHGGVARIANGDDFEMVFCLGTLTPRTPANDAKYRAMLDAGQLGYLVPARQVGGRILGWKESTRYFVTHRFVDAHWRFRTKGIAFMNMCDGLGGSAGGGFQQACVRQQAGVYLGWSATTSTDDILESAGYLFHRMLGMNTSDHAHVPPEDPPQRPFNLGTVFDEMRHRDRTNPSGSVAGIQRKLTESFNVHNLGHTHVLPSGNATLTYASVGPADIILRPSIERVVVLEEKGELFVRGEFGHQAGAVTLGDAALTVKQWSEDAVTCQLPETGAGDVVVAVHGHHSNPRRVLLWRGTLVQNEEHTTPPIGSQGVTITTQTQIVYSVALRQDIDGTRSRPGGGIMHGAVEAHAIEAESSVTHAYNSVHSQCGQIGTTNPVANIAYVFPGSTYNPAESHFRFRGNFTFDDHGQARVDLLFFTHVVDGLTFDYGPCGNPDFHGKEPVTLGGSAMTHPAPPAFGMTFNETTRSQSSVSLTVVEPLDPLAPK